MSKWKREIVSIFYFKIFYVILYKIKRYDKRYKRNFR
jgi:hypothetical protein